MSTATRSTTTTSPLRPVVTAEQIERDASSYVDPHGFVFHYSSDIYRCVHEQHAGFYGNLIKSGLIRRWEESFHLVSSEAADFALADHPRSLVLRHERIDPLTYCVEWCPSMLRKAGLSTLNLAVELIDHGLMLQDAYPWNVLFRGTEPVFVDLTSIVPADEKTIWPAHEQYESFFYRPLVLAVRERGDVARALLHNNISGIGIEQFYGLLPASYRVCHPGLVLSHWMHRRLTTSRQLKAKVRRLAAKAAGNFGNDVRKRFFQRLIRRLEKLQIPHSTDPWKNYYSEIAPQVDKKKKLIQVRQFLDQLEPATVLDLGCNTGVFSIEAARCGAHVTSVDSSQACIEALFRASEEQKLRITPLVTDICCPTGSFGYMGKQYPCIWDRVRADVVLCLGLMHHLHLAGRQSFERIASLMSAVSRRHLILEFVSRDDENIELLPERRKITYDLEEVTTALQKHFPQVQVHESDRSTRRLLLCSK